MLFRQQIVTTPVALLIKTLANRVARQLVFQHGSDGRQSGHRRTLRLQQLLGLVGIHSCVDVIATATDTLGRRG